MADGRHFKQTKNGHISAKVEAIDKKFGILIFRSYNTSVPNNSCCIIYFLYWSGFGMLLCKTNVKHSGTFHPRYQTCPLHPLSPLIRGWQRIYAVTNSQH